MKMTQRVTKEKTMKARTSVALLVLATLGVTACVDDDRMFYISQALAPDSSCSVSTGGTSLWGGILDVSVSGYGYYLNPVVVNQMLSTTGDGQPERNVIHMRGFKIDAPSPIADFEIPASGAIKPNGEAVFAAVEVLRPADAAMMASQVSGNNQPVVEVKIRAFGDRSGDEMETAEFIYPITLCNGCLVNMLSACPTADDTATYTTNGCGLPQDSQVTCCPGANGVVCLAAAE